MKFKSKVFLLYIINFIISFKINPSSHSFNCLFPFFTISHNNISTMSIILFNTHFFIIFFKSNIKLFINFIFNWKSMTIPSESSINKMSIFKIILPIHCSIPTNYVFDGSSRNMTIMRGTCSKRRSIIKTKLRPIFSFF